MSKIKKAIYISPILGAMFLTILCVIYIVIFILLPEYGLITNIVSIFKIIPLLFFIFLLISYIISVPIGYFIYKEMKKKLHTNNFFVNMSLFLGFIISIIISMISYFISYSIVKSFFIIIGISLMTTINANYFLILSETIKIKEKNN
jgi:hypothetical protein